jgi:anti-sigma regulatory factor (Ser/Thr protein kinase)
LAALIRSVAANFESSQTHRVHLKGLSDPIAAEVDPRQTKKVLYNLLANAFKFTDPEDGQVWIRVSGRERDIELEIEDNGIGIPHDQLERIFERFTQVEGSATRRYEGTGIGLALVKEIVTLHGGRITVESELGRGSTFTITLPRGRANPAEMVTLEEEETIPTTLRGSDIASAVPAAADTPLLLVADDNPDMRSYLARVLGTRYRITLAKDGMEAAGADTSPQA